MWTVSNFLGTGLKFDMVNGGLLLKPEGLDSNKYFYRTIPAWQNNPATLLQRPENDFQFLVPIGWTQLPKYVPHYGSTQTVVQSGQCRFTNILYKLRLTGQLCCKWIIFFVQFWVDTIAHGTQFCLYRQGTFMVLYSLFFALPPTWGLALCRRTENISNFTYPAASASGDG